MARPPAAPRGADSQVWVFDEHPGYRRAMESAGTVAAPLLAGFSFTLLALLVPTFGQEQTTVQTGAGARIITRSDSFSALPELAAVLFLLAGLLLIASVQAAIAARYHGHSPADLEEWYPEYFPEAGEGSTDPPPEATELSGWDLEHWPALRGGNKWYPGWVRKFFHDETWEANWWASATRQLYHLGILALLAGLAVLVAPPGGVSTFWRWLLFGVAASGVLIELGWIVSQSELWSHLRGWVSGDGRDG